MIQQQYRHAYIADRNEMRASQCLNLKHCRAF